MTPVHPGGPSPGRSLGASRGTSLGISPGELFLAVLQQLLLGISEIIHRLF
jgi:hypothetical protein